MHMVAFVFVVARPSYGFCWSTFVMAICKRCNSFLAVLLAVSAELHGLAQMVSPRGLSGDFFVWARRTACLFLCCIGA